MDKIDKMDKMDKMDMVNLLHFSLLWMLKYSIQWLRPLVAMVNEQSGHSDHSGCGDWWTPDTGMLSTRANL